MDFNEINYMVEGSILIKLSLGFYCSNREIQTAEPFVPEPYISEVAIGKLKRYKSPGADHIPAELIQTGGRDITF
jgi:hypothetical protein